MTDQISAETAFSLEELQNAFSKSYGVPIGQLTIQNLLSEKRETALNTKIVTLEKEVVNLQQENCRLISAQINLENQIHTLETKLAKSIDAGHTYDQIAAQAKAIINESQEKAAP
jgi:hypothetical protein